MPLGKVDRIAEAHHLAQEIRAMAEALENAWHLLATRLCPPFVVDLGYVAGCVGILNQADFCFGARHSWRQHCCFDGQRLAHPGRVGSVGVSVGRRRRLTAVGAAKEPGACLQFCGSFFPDLDIPTRV